MKNEGFKFSNPEMMGYKLKNPKKMKEKPVGILMFFLLTRKNHRRIPFCFMGLTSLIVRDQLPNGELTPWMTTPVTMVPPKTPKDKRPRPRR